MEQNNQIIQLANVNLGYLHSSKGDSHSAIHYYVEIAEDSEVDLITKLTAMTSLTREYYLIGSLDESKLVIDKGLELFKQLHNNEAFKAHFYTLMTYRYADRKEYENYDKFLII